MRTRSVLAALTTAALGVTFAVAAPPSASAATVPGPTLRELAAQQGILIGSGAVKASTSTADDRPPNYLAEAEFRQVLSEQFESLSPENELKWAFVQPEEGVYDFEGLDRMVAFAEEHDMQVKGHGLISSCCNPDYLVEKKDDPVAFRAAMVTHFETVMQRYSGRMDRWDVVSEALSAYGGAGLQPTDFYDALGPGYVAEAFRIAHEADPDARLFLNENLVEFFPEKRAELYELVSGLVAEGVPIDGVALQMHETLAGPEPGVITEMVDSYRALGLEVSIAELDVHTYDPVQQAQIYSDVVGEALRAGVTDISFWGFTDKHLWTWLPGAKPLIFDENYDPKPAYFAVRDALSRFVGDTTAPQVTGLPTAVVNEADGLDLAVGADDPESGVESVDVTFDGATVPASGHVDLSGLAGERELTVRAANRVGLVTETTTTVLVVPVDGATSAPGAGALSNTSGWAYGLHDGSYAVVMNVWSGTPGSVFRLYENDELFSTQVLGPVGGTTQTIETPIDGKPNGTYVYRAELINSQGVTATNTTTVTVTDAAPGKPVVSHDNWDQDSSFTATANLWWGTNATSYTFLLDGAVVGEGELQGVTPAAQSVALELSRVAQGTHDLQVVFTNAAGSTTSDAVRVVVT